MTRMPSNQIDPQALVLLRQAKHWTQEELSLASGLGLRTIQRAESEGQLSPSSLRSLAAVFEIPSDDLLFSASPTPTGKPNLLGPKLGLAFGMGGAVLGGLFSISSQLLSLIHI